MVLDDPLDSDTGNELERHSHTSAKAQQPP